VIRSLLRHPLRLALAWVLLRSGTDVLRHPEPRAKAAAPLLDRLDGVPGVPSDPVVAVRANAALQVGAALLLAAGRAPRAAALALAASLVPTTLAGHPYWREEDPARRGQQRIHFDKNVAILGGLLLVAVEPGEPDGCD
jgi:uncharacterized membrane protein YphA (DoxX/SURF4 family)